MRRFERFEQSLLVKEYAEMGLPSPVQGNLELHHRVEKRRQGGDVINLSIMTDQTPPPAVRIAAAEQALKGGYIKNALAVRQKVCQFYAKDRDAHYDPETEIFLTTGSQLGLDSAFKLLIDPGDEVLMGEPEYATYEPMIHFYGGRATFCPLVLRDSSWAFDLDAFAKAVTPQTKLVVMSHPNNPVGYVYRKAELQEIVRIVQRSNCWVLSDEIWSTLLLKEDLEFVSMGVFAEIRDRLIILFSASKSFGMSGYRVGAIMGPADFINAVDQVVRFAIQAAPTIGQVAFARALDLGETGPWLEQRKAELRRRVRDSIQRMGGLRKLRCAEPESGVFLFPYIADYGMGSLTFAMRLLDETGVYLLPGYFYGRHCDGYLRVSLSVSEEDYSRGMTRFLDFVKALEG